MRVVREQMLCVVTPSWEDDDTVLKAASTQASMTELLAVVKVVHFATFALLPGRSSEREGSLPSLMFELAVDEGLRPVDLIDLLVQQDNGILWTLYHRYAAQEGLPANATLGQQQRWLRGFLSRHVHVADGAFAGVRDRHCAQILQEAELFEATRQRRATLPPPVDRESFALALARWAMQQPRFDWATTPAPRSYWRAGGATGGGKLLYLAGLIGIVLALLGLGWAFFGAAAWVMPLRVPPLQSWASIAGVCALATAGLAWVVQAVVAAVTLAMVYVLLFLLLPGLMPSMRPLLSPVRETLGHRFAWALLLVLFVLAPHFVNEWLPLVKTAAEVTAAVFGWLIGAVANVVVNVVWIVALGLFVFAVLPAFIPPLRRALDRLNKAIDRPTATPAGYLLYPVGLVCWAAVIASLPLIVWGILQWPVQLLAPHWTFAHLLHNVHLGWTWGMLGWAVLAVVAAGLLLWALFVLLPRLFPGWGKWLRGVFAWFNRPRQEEIPRAHQVHPSIDACEAERIGGTAHIISLTEIKCPYAWNRFWLRLSLRAVTLFGRIFFTEGRLGDAPGIKFGHWHIIDDGRRLLFTSNYDGSFGGYLDDFINGASRGTNMFWRWTELSRRPAALPNRLDEHPHVPNDRAFPPTRYWLWRGVKCEQWFKAYARDSMLPHLFHFEAYKHTVNDIDRATRLRNALFGERTAAKDDQIMRALES